MRVEQCNSRCRFQCYYATKTDHSTLEWPTRLACMQLDSNDDRETIMATTMIALISSQPRPQLHLLVTNRTSSTCLHCIASNAKFAISRCFDWQIENSKARKSEYSSIRTVELGNETRRPNHDRRARMPTTICCSSSGWSNWICRRRLRLFAVSSGHGISSASATREPNGACWCCYWLCNNEMRSGRNFGKFAQTFFHHHHPVQWMDGWTFRDLHWDWNINMMMMMTNNRLLLLMFMFRLGD